MRIRNILLLIGFIVVSVACKQQIQSAEPTLMVTIEPLRYFTEQIVGEQFKVVSMVPKGTSPETYDPTPQQLMALAKSKAYLQIGYIGFELSWIDKLKENTPYLPFFDTSKGIQLIEAEDHNHGDHQHGGVEPHIWNSARNAKIIAQNILQAVIQLDSIHKDDYTENYRKLVEELDETDKEIQNIIKEHPFAAGFMIYHPALSYFARDYGIEQISIEKEGKEPTPSHLKKLIETCKAKNIHVIFVQPEFDIRNAEIIAEQTNSQIIPIDPLSYDWKEQMLHVAKSLILFIE